MAESRDEKLDTFWKWLKEDIGRNIFSKSKEPIDDWTLVVKLHAMIETGLNGAILIHLGEPELEAIIQRLDTHSPAGKVAFAKALKIIPKTSATFIQQLSELRNFCVHDIRNFDFDLTKHLDSLKLEKRKQFEKAIRDMHGKLKSRPSIQHQLFFCTIMTMAALHGHAIQRKKRDLTAKSIQAAEEWDAMWDEWRQSNSTE